MALGGWRGVAAAVACVTVGLAVAGAPRAAGAFCGFYVSGASDPLVNRATRVALMREGTRTVMSMSNDYQGPPQDFAMVVPVPVVLQQANVHTLPMALFDHLEQLTAPRLVEYWEQDPCYVPPRVLHHGHGVARAPMAMNDTSGGGGGLGVRIEARFTVGEYNVLVLSASQSSGLETWLHLNHYNIPQGAAAYLAPYVREQWKFFVARVDIHRVARRPDGTARLSPLRFHYDTPEFRLPVRLGLLNAQGQQDLIVYVLAPHQRYELANYPNVFIPTNLDVTDDVRARFPEFYAGLFDATLASAGGRAVVTEYAWASNTCDPCPGPALDEGELESLGGDALRAAGGAAFSPYDVVITRLHTRYSPAVLTDDLVFRAAQPAVGGREFVRDANGGLEQGATVDASGTNNFQARYAIRHPWTGPIACAHPQRGIWGGPPGGASRPAPVAARDLAEAPRGTVELARVVRTAVPSLHLTGRAPHEPAGGGHGGRAPHSKRGVPWGRGATGATVGAGLAAAAVARARRKGR